MNEDYLYLSHVHECIEWIEDYTRGGQSEFMQARMIRDAVLRNFEVMGEAIKHLSSDIRQQYPDVPWQRIAGFRDILIHNYVGVDFDMVWAIVETLPSLKRRITAIMSDLGRASDSAT